MTFSTASGRDGREIKMKIPKSGPEVERLFGYIIFVFGALSTIQYLAVIVSRHLPIDMGIALGNGALVLIGLVAISTAVCLTALEQRLLKLENARAVSRD
jgi:hypothetical protein